jgi:lysophospholipase L1-like esterase
MYVQAMVPKRRRTRRPPAAFTVVGVAVVFLSLSACQSRWSHTQRTATANGPVSIVALGDSYSSGAGNPPFAAEAGSCDRSAVAWPYLLASLHSGRTAAVFACAGAKSDALTHPFKGQPAQVQQLAALPKAPDVVTVTIGGNDARFSAVLVSCVLYRCFWDGNETRRRNYIKNDLPAILRADYSAVKAAAPKSRVLVVGYPMILPRSRSDSVACPWLEDRERRQLNSLASELESVMRRAASKADVDFVSTASTLRGHELCTRDSWVRPIGLNPLQSGYGAHPLRAGQQAIADAVDRHLSARGV